MVDVFSLRGVLFYDKQKDAEKLFDKSSPNPLEIDTVELKLELALKRLEKIAESKINSKIKSYSMDKELEIVRKKIDQFEVKNSEINGKLSRAMQSVRNILED